MFSIFLVAHSLLRWVLLGLAAALAFASVSGLRAGRGWTGRDEALHRATVGAADLQLLLGLLLYFVASPLTHAFLAAPGAFMKDPTVRFFAVEHVVAMLAAIVLLHVARVRAKRLEGTARHRLVARSTLVALVLMLAGIPWPGRPYERPLVRLSEVEPMESPPG